MKKLLSIVIVLCCAYSIVAQRPISISVAAVNAKEAYPVGLGEAHVIEAGTDITYTIYFQNNGVDTAYNVKIIDTLSSHLDVGSIRKEGSSHMNDFSIVDGNVLKVSYANIRLPNISINETTSRGFISFTITVKENLPVGTAIFNRATISFDFNPPIMTNAVYHTIGDNVVNFTNDRNLQTEVNIFPNPITDVAVIELGNADFKNGELLVFNMEGKMVHAQFFDATKFEFKRGELSPGQYFFSILLDGHPKVSGKFLAQ